ncbi:MAG: phage holin family protein [Planctomycetota bacterium]
MGSEHQFTVIGLTCCIVGIFLLANSIVFRSPRRLIEEYFGIGAGSMRPVRDYVLNKIQVVIGFLFLMAGFILQALVAWGLVDLWTKIVCGLLLASAAGVYFWGKRHSRRIFQQILRQHFREHEFDFVQNMGVTKQIGKAFGIVGSAEDSVEKYVAMVMLALDLDPTRPREESEREQRARRLREMAPLPMPPRRTNGGGNM